MTDRVCVMLKITKVERLGDELYVEWGDSTGMFGGCGELIQSCQLYRGDEPSQMAFIHALCDYAKVNPTCPVVCDYLERLGG